MAINPETKIGLVVIGGLAILAIGILSLGEIQLQKGYKLKVLFNDVGGLPEKSPVKSAGVDIGKVVAIDLVDSKAQVTIWLKENIRIHRDAKITIVSTGVIGTKYMEMTIGSSNLPVLTEQDIVIGIDPLSVDKVVAEGLRGFTDLAEAIKAFAGDKELKDALIDVLKNIRDISASLKGIISTEEENIHGIVENFKIFSEKINTIGNNIDNIVKTNSEDIETTLKSFKAVSEKLNTALDSINTITKDIQAGKGTLGQLIADKEISKEVEQTVRSLSSASKEANNILQRISRIQTSWDYQLNYNNEDKVFRSDFGLQFRPKPDKFYFIGMNNINEKEDSDYDKGDQRINSITAKIGKDFGAFTVYGGALRSTGGIGAAWRPFESKIMEFNTEAYRFGREVEGKSKAWVNAGGSLRVMQWCYLRVNVEDLLHNQSLNTSLNLMFEDEDLAYLLGLTGLSNLVK